MRIGELAARTGTSVRALRHYDQAGVLSSVRQENGYRTFTPDDIARVRLIRLFLSVGFTLDEIRRFAPCWQDGHGPDDPAGNDVAADFYRRKLADIDAQLRDLHVIRDRLTTQLSELTGTGPACAPTLEDPHEPDARP
ncbi:MerR family transcriptional regulator [Deinococcus sp. JMULE3]|uniref:MerR family transcriptional regulator n=1 Tax=Deinococcus sp. JMULE3 TaxID=2518341 RepID=UPI001576AC7D|nr:MerR family transcriptional regulator [Deinococcus sp. JMULE3]NTY02392.1 MerR family transcriptional regulator [Deinococcus sp. JMULE3]